ncbi:MAG: NAD(P)/FAD-dependent oxidoreductase, partial [Rhodoferax sp.]
MNLGIEQLPAACDVLVVGAGPAGSAAAQLLARGGLDVVLIDQHAFPRDKVCGDGLIPDAHQALRRLGVWDAVMAQAQPAHFVRCIGPRGGRLDVPAMLAVLPRRQLDEIVCRAAIAAGARMFAPLRFLAPLEENGTVVGVWLQQGGITREVRARWVVLATGATAQALLATGMALRQVPSGVALRGYVRHPAMAATHIDVLEVVWQRALAPGYGWIF